MTIISEGYAALRIGNGRLVFLRSNSIPLSDVVAPWTKEHGSLQGLILQAEKFPGWNDFATMVKHFQFLKNHHKKIHKVAIVADGIVAEAGPTIADYFVDAEIKHFVAGDHRAAVDYVSH